MSARSLWPSAVGAALLFCLLPCSGCAREGGEPAASGTIPLAFDAPIHEEGVVRSRVDGQCTIEHAFTYRVWDRCPVRIVRVETSCGCLVPVLEKEKEDLAPGSQGALTIRLELGGRAGPVSGRALVMTEPPSDTALLLTMGAIAVVEPLVVPNPVTIRTPKTIGVPVSLKVTYLRQQEEASLRLRETASDFGPFTLVDRHYLQELRLDPKVLDRPLAVDRATIQLETRRALPIGKHDFTLRLAWEGLEAPTQVPVSLHVEPPISLPLGELFFGTLKPGQKVQMRIPLKRSDAALPVALKARSDLECVQADIGPSADDLRVSVHAPQKEGRFSGVIRIHSAKQGAKPGQDDVLELPVSGIVERDAP